MICIEDYPIIETAINKGTELACKYNYNGSTKVITMLALAWVDGWITSNKVSEKEANIIRTGVKNYIFI